MKTKSPYPYAQSPHKPTKVNRLLPFSLFKFEDILGYTPVNAIAIYMKKDSLIAEIYTNEIEDFKHAQVLVSATHLNAPFSSKTDNFETLSKILIHDSQRNQLILEDIKNRTFQRKKRAIMTERKEHIDIFYHFLKHFCEIVAVSGDDMKVVESLNDICCKKVIFKF